MHDQQRNNEENKDQQSTSKSSRQIAKKNAEASQNFVNSLLQYSIGRDQKVDNMNKTWDNAMLKIIIDSVNVRYL